jgi:hypothetical protein
MILSLRRADSIIPCPRHESVIENRSLAVNCQATIVQSLRDKSDKPLWDKIKPALSVQATNWN